jgi:hypothetical protein
VELEAVVASVEPLAEVENEDELAVAAVTLEGAVLDEEGDWVGEAVAELMGVEDAVPADEDAVSETAIEVARVEESCDEVKGTVLEDCGIVDVAFSVEDNRDEEAGIIEVDCVEMVGKPIEME